MTLIEFLDNDDIENVCSSLALNPNKVILLSSNKTLREKCEQRYQAFFDKRGRNIEFTSESIDRNDVQGLLKKLSFIIENNEDCVFDLTGGDDLCLVAIGVLLERYKDKSIRTHRINVPSGTILDIVNNQKRRLDPSKYQLTVEDNIQLRGGEIIYDNVDANATHRMNLDYGLRRDILTMWDICRKNPKEWNQQLDIIARANANKEETENPLAIRVSMSKLIHATPNNAQFKLEYQFFKKLYDNTILSGFDFSNGHFGVRFKNELVKSCLVTSGKILELILFLAAQDLKEENSLICNDVMTGVVLDWDGKNLDRAEGKNPFNEIDIILMRGMTPVFVSCKNGSVKAEELYKFNAVAKRFGGKYGKKILISTLLESQKEKDLLIQRAKDMGICIVSSFKVEKKQCSIESVPFESLKKCIATFWD